MAKAKGKEEGESKAQLNFSVSVETHEKLRKLAFETRKSISQLCREFIELALAKQKKGNGK